VNKRILIADDEARVLLILRDALQKLGKGIEIVTVSSGAEAMIKSKERAFDLLISDLRMPGIDGIELARLIKTSNPDTTIIWITAYGCHQVAAEVEDLGVYVCLDKPLEIQQIRKVVREALEKTPGSAGPEGERTQADIPVGDHPDLGSVRADAWLS
jgi:DNA-binding NtrC family response regulator